jgi:hypothetical protein
MPQPDPAMLEQLQKGGLGGLPGGLSGLGSGIPGGLPGLSKSVTGLAAGVSWPAGAGEEEVATTYPS